MGNPVASTSRRRCLKLQVAPVGNGLESTRRTELHSPPWCSSKDSPDINRYTPVFSENSKPPRGANSRGGCLLRSPGGHHFAWRKTVQGNTAAGCRERAVLKHMSENGNEERCPHVPRLIQATRDESGEMVLCMTHKPGIPLDKIIGPGGLLLSSDCSPWLRNMILEEICVQLDLAVTAFHDTGCAHGDLHPGNIIIEKIEYAIHTRNPKAIKLHLVDLGEAWMVGSYAKPKRNTLTSPGYADYADQSAGESIPLSSREGQTASPRIDKKQVIKAQRGDYFAQATISLILVIALELQGRRPHVPEAAAFSGVADRLRSAFDLHVTEGDPRRLRLAKMLDALKAHLGRFNARLSGIGFLSDDEKKPEAEFDRVSILNGNFFPEEPSKSALVRTAFEAFSNWRNAPDAPGHHRSKRRRCSRRDASSASSLQLSSTSRSARVHTRTEVLPPSRRESLLAAAPEPRAHPMHLSTGSAPKSTAFSWSIAG